jgi:hypothetical protein
VDINIGGIGLNDAQYLNSYVLEEFENSLYPALEPVIVANVVVSTPRIREPVVDLLVDEEFTLILEELNDSENLTGIEGAIGDLQSLIDSKLELSEPGSSADSVIDPYFIEVSRLLEQQNDQEKLAILCKVSEIDLDDESKAQFRDYLLDSDVSASLADAFLAAIANGADEEKLEFIENNKYIISAQNIDDQQMILVSLQDTDNLIEDDTAFTKALMDLIKAEKRDKVDILLKGRELNLTEDEQSKFLELILNQSVSATVAESFIDIASSTDDLEKLSYLEANKYEISRMLEDDQKNLLTCLLDSANSSENDLLRVTSMQYFIETGDRDRLTVLDKTRNLNLDTAQEKQFINYLWVDSDIAKAYLDILESGLDILESGKSQEKLDFLNKNKDLIGASSDATQAKILDSLLDKDELTEQDIFFAETILNLAGDGDFDKKLEILEEGRQLINLNADQELQLLNYLSDDEISVQLSQNYLKMFTEDTEKLNFIETNKYLISKYDELTQNKIFDFLQDDRKLTNSDLSFTEKLLNLLELGDEKGIDLLDKARDIELNSNQEDKFLDYIDDEAISSTVTNAYLDLVMDEANEDKINFLELNKYIISSLDEAKQKKVMEYLMDSDYLTENDTAFTSKLLTFIKNGDEKGIEALDLARQRVLGDKKEDLFLEYLSLTDTTNQIQLDKLLQSLSINRSGVNLSFSDVFNTLKKQGDKAKLNLLIQGNLLEMDVETRNQWRAALIEKDVSADFAKTYLDLVKSNADPSKLNFLAENKFIISELDKELQKKVFDSVTDSADFTEDDVSFAKTYLSLARRGDLTKLNLLEQNRKTEFSSEQEEKFLDYLSDANVSVSLIDAFLDVVSSGADAEKLKYLSENKYLISSSDTVIQDKVLDCLLDSDKLTKDDTAFADTLITLLRNQDTDRLGILLRTRDLDLSLEHEQEERFLNYFLNDNVSLGFTETYLTLLNSGADTEKLDFIDDHKYAISSLSAVAQTKVLNYLADENAVINQKQPETFSLLSKLNILEESSVLSLNKTQEKQLLNYIMDNKVSADLTSTYVDLVNLGSESEKVSYLEDNKYLISSYDKKSQKTLSEYLVDKENKADLDLVYVINLSNFIQEGDSGKITVLESSRGLGLGVSGERQFFSYLADNKLSADFAKAYLDLFTFEASSGKYSCLENNKYLVADLSQPNQDRFFKYLVDSDDKLHEDLLFTKVLLHFAKQGSVSKTNALDSGFELDLDAPQEKQFLRYLLNSKLSSKIAVGYAELATTNITTNVLDLLKNNQSSISLLNIGLQEQLADQMKAAANHSEESLPILGLSFSLIRDYKIDKSAAVELSEILESDQALEGLQNFKQNNKLQRVIIDPKSRLHDTEVQSSAQKISKLGKFLGVNVEASQSNNVTAVNKMIEALLSAPLKQFETKQDREQKILGDYQSRLDSYTVLIMDELSKGDKLDPKKLELLQARRNNLENSIQAIENSRNSITSSTQRDPYIQRQIDEILANRVSLNVF